MRFYAESDLFFAVTKPNEIPDQFSFARGEEKIFRNDVIRLVWRMCNSVLPPAFQQELAEFRVNHIVPNSLKIKGEERGGA